MININWMALLQVAAVTFGATIIVVAIVSMATALVEKNRLAVESGKIESPYKAWTGWAAILLFGTAFAIVAFGLYLLIPWWH
ncbi:MAG: hypothetical protein CR979_02155 [Propionibacterium sp.]|nr:MAG: hypothetical protein CR979_02155 [Propionibacterium sp.]